MLPVYPVVKSTHLYSLADNFVIWQVSHPLPASREHWVAVGDYRGIMSQLFNSNE
jgi:hypothetical protein